MSIENDSSESNENDPSEWSSEWSAEPSAPAGVERARGTPTPETPARDATGRAEPRAAEEITVLVRQQDLERLDHAATRRGIERSVVISEAIDAFLAREIWSGGFVSPPKMEIPRKYPWKPGAFRLRRRE